MGLGAMPNASWECAQTTENGQCCCTCIASEIRCNYTGNIVKKNMLLQKHGLRQCTLACWQYKNKTFVNSQRVDKVSDIDV